MKNIILTILLSIVGVFVVMAFMEPIDVACLGLAMINSVQSLGLLGTGEING